MTVPALLWGTAAVAALILLRRPLAAVCRLAVRAGAGWCCLWVFNWAGGLFGLHLGVNLVNALILGILGAPGLGLLLLCQWALM